MTHLRHGIISTEMAVLHFSWFETAS